MRKQTAIEPFIGQQPHNGSKTAEAPLSALFVVDQDLIQPGMTGEDFPRAGNHEDGQMGFGESITEGLKQWCGQHHIPEKSGLDHEDFFWFSSHNLAYLVKTLKAASKQSTSPCSPSRKPR